MRVFVLHVVRENLLLDMAIAKTRNQYVFKTINLTIFVRTF